MAVETRPPIIMFSCFCRLLERAVFELFFMFGQNYYKPCDGVTMVLISVQISDVHKTLGRHVFIFRSAELKKKTSNYQTTQKHYLYI